MNNNNQDTHDTADNNVNEVEDECPAHLVLVPQLSPSVPLPKIVHLKKPIVTVGRQKNEPDPVDMYVFNLILLTILKLLGFNTSSTYDITFTCKVSSNTRDRQPRKTSMETGR